MQQGVLWFKSRKIAITGYTQRGEVWKQVASIDFVPTKSVLAAKCAKTKGMPLEPP